jgi:hypothetical protein
MLMFAVPIAVTAAETASDRLAEPRLKAIQHPAPRPKMVVGEFDTVVPQVVDGATWQTSFFLTNLGTQTAYFAVYFSDDTGALMELPLVQYGPTYSLLGQLAPNQSVEFKTPGTGAKLMQGSAQIFALDRPGDDPNAQVVFSTLGGYAIFRWRAEGHPDFEAVVPISPTFEPTFTLFFDNRDGYSSGVAVVNGGSEVSSVLVTARDLHGTQLLTDGFTLQSGEKRVFSVPERYRSLQGKVGVLQFSTTNLTLSGLGLRFTPGGAFTSAHTLSLNR